MCEKELYRETVFTRAFRLASCHLILKTVPQGRDSHHPSPAYGETGPWRGRWAFRQRPIIHWGQSPSFQVLSAHRLWGVGLPVPGSWDRSSFTHTFPLEPYNSHARLVSVTSLKRWGGRKKTQRKVFWPRVQPLTSDTTGTQTFLILSHSIKIPPPRVGCLPEPVLLPQSDHHPHLSCVGRGCLNKGILACGASLKKGLFMF